MRSKVLGVAIQRRAITTRQHQQLKTFTRNAGLGTWRGFLKHHVRVGSTDTQRVHGRTPPRTGKRRRKLAELVVHEERSRREVDVRVRLLEVHGRRQLAMLQRQTHLDQARDTSRRIEVTDIGLHRSNATEGLLICRLAERLSQGSDLNRIADRCPGAVALHVPNRVRVHTGHRERFCDGGGLALHTGRQVANLARTVVVDRRAFDHCVDLIAIAQRVFQPTQHHHARAAAEHGACRAMIKRATMTIG